MHPESCKPLIYADLSHGCWFHFPFGEGEAVHPSPPGTMLLRLVQCTCTVAFGDPAAFQEYPLTVATLGLAQHLISPHFFLTWLLSSRAAVPGGDPTGCLSFWRCSRMGRIHILISKASGNSAAGVAGLQLLEHLRWIQPCKPSLLPVGPVLQACC